MLHILKLVIMFVSYICLAMLVIAPARYFMGSIDLPATINTLNIATLVWFVTAPFWMNHPQKKEEEDEA